MPRRFFLHLLALLPIWILGVVHLPHPFEGDQALFMVGAQHLEAGDLLYADFWDVKQPGIYLFYWLAGKWFGFTEVGAHALELVWFTLLVPFCVAMLRPYFDRPWLAAFAPLATIGLYYGMSAREHLTQLEILVGPLLFLCAALAARTWGSRRAQMLAWFGSGALASVVVTFKLALAPIPLTVWTVAALVRLWQGRKSAIRPLLADLAAGFVGGVSVLAVVAFGFHLHGSLDQLIWTSFQYPVEAISDTQLAPANRLVGSAMWFGSHAAPLVAFFLCFGLAKWRGLGRETLTLQLMGWLVIACFVIAVQRWSWWQYHFLILIMPAGILGLRGLDAVASSELFSGKPVWRVARISAVALILICPAFVNWSVKARNFAKHVQLGTSWYGPYQIASENAYREIWEATHFLRADANRDPIHVFGDPLYLYLSEREQALREKGWVPENHLPSQWQDLPVQLLTARPAWIFVDAKSHPMITELSPDTHTAIQALYEETQSCERGTWFRLRDES